jgi:hypothetical protein
LRCKFGRKDSSIQKREEDPTARLGRLKEEMKEGISDYIESSFRRYLDE